MKIKNLIFFILHIILSCIAVISINLLPADIEFPLYNFSFSIIVILTCSIQILTLYFSSIRSFYAMFFLLITYVYNCSQPILYALGEESAIFHYANIYNKFGYQTYVDVNSVAMTSIQLFFLGCLFANLLYDNNMEKMSSNDCQENKQLVLIGKIFLCVSIPFMIYVQIIFFAASYISYVAVHEAAKDINAITKLLADMPIVGISALILGCKKNVSKKIYVMSMFCYAGLMATGLRAYNAGFMFILSYLYFNRVIKLKFTLKKMLPWIIVGYCFAALMINISETRGEIHYPLVFLESYLGLLFSFDVPIKVLGEMSTTQYVLGAVTEFDKYRLFAHQLIGSIISIVPFVSYLLPDATIIHYQVQDTLGIWTFGGSFISDFYFDRLTYIGPFVFGVIIYKLFIKFEKTNDYLKMCYLTYILIIVLFCARSTIAKLPRTIVWYTILFMTIKQISNLFISRKN